MPNNHIKRSAKFHYNFPEPKLTYFKCLYSVAKDKPETKPYIEAKLVCYRQNIISCFFLTFPGI